MIILDGKIVSEKILDSLKPINKSLHVILIGNDPSSQKYVSLKQKKCQQTGVDFTLHHLKDDKNLPHLINQLNHDSSVDGFFIQLPLKNKQFLKLISPTKDVDGLNPNSKFTPAVVVGIIKLLESYNLSFNNQKVVIINDSELIGQPLKKYFPQAILCNDQTKDLPKITQTADLLISATGVKNLVSTDKVKDGAVVIDVANGDVDFANVAPKCSYITPTFGGIGPMTIASLLYNLSQV
jgi:methylenetetrahydrofolate dehydrogenase (NADP+)/methenyltetrahydrofolate cyclohydrolase